MKFEIRQVKNGYMIFSEFGPQYVSNYSGAPWVFETLDAALNFLRKEFEKKPKEEPES